MTLPGKSSRFLLMSPSTLKQLPLWATLFRILVVPFIVIFMLLQPAYWNWICAILFILASVSDWPMATGPAKQG